MPILFNLGNLMPGAPPQLLSKIFGEYLLFPAEELEKLPLYLISPNNFNSRVYFKGLFSTRNF